MTDKYQQVFDLLDNPITANEVSRILKWNKPAAYHYLKRLEDLGYIKKVTLAQFMGAPCEYSKIARELSADDIENLRNRKSKHRSEIVQVNTEINAIYNNYLHGITPAEITAKARVIKENYSYSEKKQSPRVYVGCSFNQVGW